MSEARLIVCERSGDWALALRRTIGSGELRVYETRSLEDCWQELAAHGESMVAVEATAANLGTLIPWVKRATTEWRDARIVVLGARGLEPGEWLLREAGAVHVVFSPRELEPLMRLVRRHLAAVPEMDEEPDRQAMWRRLPWPEAVPRGSARA